MSDLEKTYQRSYMSFWIILSTGTLNTRVFIYLCAENILNSVRKVEILEK